MHALDEAVDLRLATRSEDGGSATFAGRTSERYWNAIGPFGGWIGAVLMNSVLRTPGVRDEPLVLNADFMGGIREGAFEVRVQRVRQNRTIGFWRSEIWQEGRICAQALVTMGSVRQSMTVSDARFPDVPAPEAVPVYVNPRSPVKFIHEYVFRSVSGRLFTRADSMSARLWVRDAEPRPVDAVSLAALCDTPFPSIWIRLDGPVPVSTVSYSIYFRASAEDLADAGSGYVLLDTRADLAQGGYLDQFTAVWSSTGRLLAQTQQMIWFSDQQPDGTGGKS